MLHLLRTGEWNLSLRALIVNLDYGALINYACLQAEALAVKTVSCNFEDIATGV